MEDKRVIKTKRNLKRTMIEMICDMPFEKITVSELCRLGETSRITFYTHYDDKYDLAEEIFGDYVKDDSATGGENIVNYFKYAGGYAD